MLIKYIFLQLSMYAVLSYILKYNIWHINFFLFHSLIKLNEPLS